jgi:hypothetical protein
MAEPRDSSHPPSDPHPTHGRREIASRTEHDSTIRVQLGAALLVGLVFVAAGLLLWRPPLAPAGALAIETPASSASSTMESAGAPIAAADAGGPSAVTLSDARILACHDRGPKTTPADQCDHLSSVEKALANAVEQSASCARESVSGGTIEYVADVSFRRNKVSIVLPRSGRSVHDRKVLVACASAVRNAMTAVPLDGVAHQHSRYRISVLATYLAAATAGLGAVTARPR